MNRFEYTQQETLKALKNGSPRLPIFLRSLIRFIKRGKELDPSLISALKESSNKEPLTLSTIKAIEEGEFPEELFAIPVYEEDFGAPVWHSPLIDFNRGN